MHEVEGIVVGMSGGIYRVRIPDEGVINCSIKGKIKRQEQKGILVGDYVEVQIADLSASIERVNKRRNELIRPAISNVDQALVVTTARNPHPNFGLMDRILALVEKAKIDPVICINKVDLAIDDDIENILSIYRKTGYRIIELSTKTGIGAEELKDVLKGKISVLAGPSGSGKSSIINLIQPEMDLAVGQLSRKIERGKHTTREVKLLPLEFGGFVADTPGFSVLELEFEEEVMVQDVFPEIRRYKEECRFTGCLHHMEPDCRVKEEISLGNISKERYERYLELMISAKEARQNMYKR